MACPLITTYQTITNDYVLERKSIKEFHDNPVITLLPQHNGPIEDQIQFQNNYMIHLVYVTVCIY